MTLWSLLFRITSLSPHCWVQEGKCKWPWGGLKLNQRKNFSSFGVVNNRSRAPRRAVESVSCLRWETLEGDGGWRGHVQGGLHLSQTLSFLVQPLHDFFCLQLSLSFPLLVSNQPVLTSSFLPSCQFFVNYLQLLVSCSIISLSDFQLPILCLPYLWPSTLANNFHYNLLCPVNTSGI